MDTVQLYGGAEIPDRTRETGKEVTLRERQVNKEGRQGVITTLAPTLRPVERSRCCVDYTTSGYMSTYAPMMCAHTHVYSVPLKG